MTHPVTGPVRVHFKQAVKLTSHIPYGPAEVLRQQYAHAGRAAIPQLVGKSPRGVRGRAALRLWVEIPRYERDHEPEVYLGETLVLKPHLAPPLAIPEHRDTEAASGKVGGVEPWN